jgi:tryptophan synthase alpha chain
MIVAGSALDAVFARARAEHRAALIAYIMAGDPDTATTSAVIDALSLAGVDLIELGIPYGDPLADGPTIAAAAQRALEGGMRMAHALAIARDARARGSAPILLFTYINPVDRYGTERFAREAAGAGVAGVLVPDVPLEELASFAAPLHARGIAVPLMVAPTTPSSRAARIAASASGFIYVVARLGVTGARREPDIDGIAATIRELRQTTALPLAVGFGISTPAHVAAIGAVADGVIVGSALIDAAAGRRGPDAARAAGAYAATLRGALPHRA